MLMSEAIEKYVRYKEGLGEKPRVKKVCPSLFWQICRPKYAA